jgi:hypothetical protein
MASEDIQMAKEMRLGELGEDEIQKLPYLGPTSRRIYVITQTEGSTMTRELFVQRRDAFTTNLVGLLKSIKAGEISEIRYSTGFDGFFRIFLDERGRLAGEYSCKSEETLQDLKKRLEIK